MIYLSGRVKILCVIICCLFASFSFAASPAELTGSVEVVLTDEKDGDATFSYSLVDNSGKFYLLNFNRHDTQDLKSGDKIEVSGILNNSTLPPIFSVSTFTKVPVFSLRSGSGPVSGARALLMVRVHYSDTANSCSKSHLTGMMWDNEENVNDYFIKISNGLLSFPKDADGDSEHDIIDVHIDIPFSPSASSNYLGDIVRTAVFDMGVDWNLYHHRVMVFPFPTSTSTGGSASTACNQYACKVWIYNCGTTQLLIHELGHNLGLGHSNTDHGNDNDDLDTYADWSCMMGGNFQEGQLRYFSSPHMSRLGWLSSDNHTEITDDGIYTIGAVEPNDAGVIPDAPDDTQVIKMAFDRRPDDNVFMKDHHYYVSYRRNLADSYSSLTGEYDRKVSVHWLEEQDPQHRDAFLITTLGNGDKWYDNQADGISVEVLDIQDAYATVQVRFEDFPPVPTPTPTPSPTATPTPPPSTGGEGSTPVGSNPEESPSVEPSPTSPSTGGSDDTYLRIRVKWNKRATRFNLIGRLTNLRTPLRGKEVSLFFEQGRKATGANFSADDSDSVLASTITNSRGKFRFRRLRQSGVYRAYASQAWSNAKVVKSKRRNASAR